MAMKNEASVSGKSRVFIDQGHHGTPYTSLEEYPWTLLLVISIKNCHPCLGIEYPLDADKRTYWVSFVT